MSFDLNLKVFDDVIELIGWTPLVRLKKIERYFSVNNRIYAKLEMFNPGGSVKDRIGLYMLKNAVESGLIKEGCVVIEPTSGNTGIGLAIVSKAYNLKNVFIMPRKMSKEKELILKSLGGYVIRTPTKVSADHPLSYYNVAKALRNYIWSLNKAVSDDLLREIVDAFQNAVDEENIALLKNYLVIEVKPTKYAYIPNQYFNKLNPAAHYETTAREIYLQTGGKVDIVFAGMGTGGTITGVARYLKERKKVKIVGIDPEGSVYHHLKAGLPIEEAAEFVSTYEVEGIGEDMLPQTIDLNIIDDIVIVDDQHSFSMARIVSKLEGLLIGGSSGSALYGALKYLKDYGIQNKDVVVIFPDTGRNYLTKFYDDEWMISHGFEINDEEILKCLR